MAETDLVLYREFKQMMAGRRTLAKPFNIADLPIPQQFSQFQIPKRVIVSFRGIKEPFFDKLNNTAAELVGRTQLFKRKYLADGSFQRDAKGNYVTTPVSVPMTSLAILSKISIGLRREVNGKVHRVSDGFMYVDYLETPVGRKFIYIVPRDYIYRLNLCALIITPNRRRIFLKGARIALQNGSFIYLYVVPYRYRESEDARVLMVKDTYDFDKEVNFLLQHWVQLGVMFHPKLTALIDHISGYTNLGLIPLEGTIVAEDFNRLGRRMTTDKSLESTAEE